MSTGAFDGLEVLASAGGSPEEYTPGSLSFDQGYVDALADAYAEDARSRTIAYRRDYAREPKADLAALFDLLPGHIAGFEAFDGQGFISAIADALQRRMPEGNVNVRSDFCSDSYLLFSPVVRELHRAGHNYLSLDVAGWPCPPYHLLDGIEAAAEKQLFMKFALPKHSLPAVHIGEGSRHCVASISGFFTNLGTGSEHCDFTFEGVHAYPLGKDSRGSAYRFASAADISITMPVRRESVARVSDSGSVYMEFYGRGNLGYRASVALQDGHRTAFNLSDKFFWEGNTIHVPDGAGGWKEVWP